ncbi:MAG: carboxypeptidase-like regulatory domain-containing protein [Mangrovibacterium sp.]
MNTVKIFLASSAELDNDKKEFELFISRKNKDLHSRRIFLELTTWKDFISSIREGRTQDEYNRYIRSSDISIFLFHTKLGRYTREEFDNAHEAFLRSKGKYKKPRIYTYFKTDLNEQPEITKFREHIDSLDHFYDTYESMDDLFVKFGRQLDKLENEDVILKPETIDVPKIIKYAVYYFLLPLLVVGGVALNYYYFQPANMTVKIAEPDPIPALPFREGNVTLTYGDKTETLPVKDEVIFKQIPSKYKRKLIKVQFAAQGYQPVDTMVAVTDLFVFPVKRDNSMSVVFGWVRDEDNRSLADVRISIKDLNATTNEDGRFRIEIPRYLQADSVRLTAFKQGYQIWDFTGRPSQTVEWKIILKK